MNVAWAWLLGCWLALPSGSAAIQGGEFEPLYTLGARQVSVQAFGLDRHAVTNAQFCAFLRTHPEWRRSRIPRLYADREYLRHWSGDLAFPSALADAPVTYVSWFAARAYARAQGKRLPTVDEWEFVARASERSSDGSGDADFRRRILAWHSRTTPPSPPRVGSVFKNVYGIYDMHGSVWEWVDDFNSVMMSPESREGGGLDRGLYCAAGVAGAADPSDYAAYMRYAFRSSLKGRYTLKNLGFRCASTASRK